MACNLLQIILLTIFLIAVFWVVAFLFSFPSPIGDVPFAGLTPWQKLLIIVDGIGLTPFAFVATTNILALFIIRRIMRRARLPRGLVLGYQLTVAVMVFLLLLLSLAAWVVGVIHGPGLTYITQGAGGFARSLAGAALTMMPVFAVGLATWLYRTVPGKCDNCGYDVTSLQGFDGEVRCPECGAAVRREIASTGD